MFCLRANMSTPPELQDLFWLSGKLRHGENRLLIQIEALREIKAIRMNAWGLARLGIAHGSNISCFCESQPCQQTANSAFRIRTPPVLTQTTPGIGLARVRISHPSALIPLITPVVSLSECVESSMFPISYLTWTFVAPSWPLQ